MRVEGPHGHNAPQTHAAHARIHARKRTRVHACTLPSLHRTPTHMHASTHTLICTYAQPTCPPHAPAVRHYVDILEAEMQGRPSVLTVANLVMQMNYSNKDTLVGGSVGVPGMGVACRGRIQEQASSRRHPPFPWDHSPTPHSGELLAEPFLLALQACANGGAGPVSSPSTTPPAPRCLPARRWARSSLAAMTSKGAARCMAAPLGARSPARSGPSTGQAAHSSGATAMRPTG